MFRDMKLGGKIGIDFGIIILIAAILGFVGWNKVDETAQRTRLGVKPGAKEFHITHIAEAGPKVAKKKEREEFETEEPQEGAKLATGYPIDMRKVKEGEDALDSEFERY